MSVTHQQPRFLQLGDICEILNVSNSQAYALVRSGDLPAIKIGGRGQWRVETTELESYIQRSYAETREFIAVHPFGVDAARGEDLEDAIARDELVDEPAAEAPKGAPRGLRAS